MRALQTAKAIADIGSFPGVKIKWASILAKVKARIAKSCQQRWTKYIFIVKVKHSKANENRIMLDINF